MNTVLTVLHVIVCIFLIAVVLLQRGKGAEMGAVFGGGASSTVFGSRGAGNFLTKLTTGSAIVFMLTSLTLSYISTQGSGERLFEDGIEETAGAVAEEPLFEDLGTVDPETAPETATAPSLAPAAEEAEAAEPAAAAETAPAP
jgi:preprotein translocase subunit SecG